MLDKRFILENAETVQRNCDIRGVKVDVARFVELETQRRTLQSEIEELSRLANAVSKSIGQTKDPAERENRKEEGRRLREAKDNVQKILDATDEEMDAIREHNPNMTHPAAPVGRGDDANL